VSGSLISNFLPVNYHPHKFKASFIIKINQLPLGRHRNSVVRATTAHVTRVLVEQLGPERVLHQNPQKLLPMLVKFLQEGSLETR